MTIRRPSDGRHLDHHPVMVVQQCSINDGVAEAARSVESSRVLTRWSAESLVDVKVHRPA
jgi:hypothetical protein